ncbi:RNA polymerase sigma factor [Crateriforma conspicua]|uniref:RNA polymerase sigma factor n=1 Tax=Crateriforma conspicua TaxID=2527996 RepID=UPI001187F116|nr:sigma-70 family RNA polymerase sigma factor [Crateriforma conspicua]QDV62637.1 RNA polymerase sigma factor [Crateriforma conspicua]
MTLSSKPYFSSIDLVAPGEGTTEADRIVAELIADCFTRKIIHRRVTQLLRLAEFVGDTVDDLTQEFLIRLTDAMKHHDDEVGHRNPYIVSIVDRHTATMLEHRRAKVRYTADGVSLDQRINDGEVGPRAMVDLLNQDDKSRRLQTEKRDSIDATNLRDDLASVLAELPADEREFLILLREHNVTDVAEILDLPRSTVVSRLEKLTQVFEDAGLRDYLA